MHAKVQDIGPRERLFTVTGLAAELGVTARTLRFYEDRGLISPQRLGPNRVYSPRDRARMILILRGKQLGFSIREIAEFLDLYDVDPSGTEQLRTLQRAVAQRIAKLELQLAAVTETLADLRNLAAHTTQQLARHEAG